jgi:hypothetical protein
MSNEERQQSSQGCTGSGKVRERKHTQSNSKFVHGLRLIGGYFGLDPTNERLSKRFVKEEGWR